MDAGRHRSADCAATQRQPETTFGVSFGGAEMVLLRFQWRHSQPATLSSSKRDGFRAEIEKPRLTPGSGRLAFFGILATS